MLTRGILIVLAALVALPAAAQQPDRPGFDLPRGVVAGKLVRQDSGEPIGRQWLTLKGGRWSRSAATDTFGRFEFQHVPPGDNYSLSFYHNGYEVRSHGPFEVGTDQSVEVDFQAVPVDPQIAPYTYSDTYLPEQNLTIMVRSIRVTDVEVDVFRYSAGDVRQRGSALIDHKTLQIPAGEKPILSYRQPVTGGHALTWRTTRVEPAFNDPGLYVVRISGAGSSKLIPVLVTRLSLITKRTPDAVWVWATDLDTGEPLRGVTVSGEALTAKDRAAASLLGARKTGKDGLVKFEGAHARNLRYWGSRGEQLAYVDTSPPSAAEALAFRTYVYTDRPAYRPGDRVHYKVIARANDGGIYRVNPGETWEVWIRDEEGQVMHRATHETNLFGTLHGELTLTDAAPLGTWSVEARSGQRVQSGRFKVLEYRKPDYQLAVATPKQQYVQGSPIEVSFQANYYFGAPLKGEKVTWTVYETPFRPWWYDDYYGDSGGATQGYGQVSHSGTAVLDPQGRATVSIEVDRASIDRYVTVEAVVSDSTGREVSARHKIMVTRGTFQVGVRPSGKIFKVGETAEFAIEARQFDGSPSPRPIEVTASLETFSTEHKIWIYRTLEQKTLRTGPDGKVNYRYEVKRDGFIRVEVKGTDPYDNPIVQSSFIWATRDAAIAGGYKKKSLDILADKSSYQPGETARVLVNTNRNDPWILFSVEGDGVFEPRVVKIDGNSRLFELPLTKKHAPNVHLAVAFAAGKSFYSLERSINVSPAHQLLTVGVESDQREYEPGQKATYTVNVTDRDGKPVQAELSAALVDAAVYAISPELAPDIGSFFYGHRPNPVRTAYSFPSRYLGGADKDELDAGGGVRRDFRDTAWWNAEIRTDENGVARFEVPLPDNLTTWRLTVRAATTETLVGGATHEIKTAKDLISTLALPRFFRRGDALEVVTMVHNRGEDLAGITATLTAGGAVTLEGEASQTLDLAGASSASLRWPVRVDGAGHEAVLKIVVRGGGLADAEERRVPVHAVAVGKIRGVSGMASVSTKQEFTLPENTVEGTPRLQVRLSGSLAGAVVESLESLATFPYGCMEQTMNAFLPDLVAHEALQELGIPRGGRLADLDRMVYTGLSRLYAMQRTDGGFGWWSGDDSRAYMTAYAVYGLARAERLGWEVNPHRLTSAIKAVMKHYSGAADWNERAFITYALSQAADDEEVAAFLKGKHDEVLQHIDGLTPYAQAVLILGLIEAGRAADARPVAATLRKAAVQDSSLAWFAGRERGYTWVDNSKETTAYADRALLALDPADPLVVKAVRWLMQRRRGGMWDTTKDTAAAVETLVEVIKASGELKSRYTARLRVNGREVGALQVAPRTVMAAATDVVVPRDLLRAGTNTLDVDLDGQGTVYWTGELRFGGPPVAEDAGMEVSREYVRVVRDTDAKGQARVTFQPLGDAPLSIGDEVEVRVTLTTGRDYHYVMLEDPLPAGFEVLPEGSDPAYTKREVRDEKVALFTTWLPAGQRTVSYRLRAEMAGTMTASPSVAQLMYMPEIMGSSHKQTLTVQTP